MKIADSAVAKPSTRWQALVSIASRASAASTRSPFSSVPAGAAERTREHGAAAETRDRDRRVGRAAAIDGEERLGFDLAVVARKFVDAKHLVEHDDAGTKNARRVGMLRKTRIRAFAFHKTRLRAFARHQRIRTSLPCSTKSRMMW
jgi:hypothetical protein